HTCASLHATRVTGADRSAEWSRTCTSRVRYMPGIAHAAVVANVMFAASVRLAFCTSDASAPDAERRAAPQRQRSDASRLHHGRTELSSPHRHHGAARRAMSQCVFHLT